MKRSVAAARRPFVFASAMLLMIASLLLSPGAQAQPANPGHIPARTPDRSLRSRLIDTSDGAPLRKISPRLLTQKGPTKVVIELQAAPTTQVYAQVLTGGQRTRAVTTAQSQLAQIEAAQQRMLASLNGLGATVIYRTQRVFNGIGVIVDSSKLKDLARLPGVKAIRPLVSKYIDNATSVPFIGAPQLWSSTNNGLTGQGLKIAIIDTGIDYLHTDFGGPGTGYDTNDPAVVEPGSFPTSKVVGGTDFVGNDYDADPTSPSYQPVPKPDPDPLDCNGHGSHVAGTAAGYGVNANGSTYTGPYNTSVNFSNLRIGPGVAPQASLYALKVFGCQGSTDVTDVAIEWAVDPNGDGDFSDRMDVINMSLGSDFGGTEDTTTVAADNAVSAGVIVVASAGNSSDNYFITGSPATSARTISVAASVDNGIVFQGIRVNSPANIAGVYQAAESAFGPPLTSTGITGTVVYAQPNNGCAALTNASAVAGKIALIDRGVCTFVAKVKNAQDAGAIAVIIVNNIAGEPSTPGGSDNTITIPSVMISQSDGAKIKQALSASQTVEVSLSSSILIPRPDLADTLASFSSRGPRRNNLALKPDIAAPGQSIFSVEAGSGNQGVSFNGTSMAAPHVAGSMALLRQLHPTWTVEELKALAMNTATNDVRSAPAVDSPLYAPSRVGAGRIDLPNAAASDVVAYNAGGPGQVSVSYGDVEVLNTVTAVRRITVLNKGTTSATYDVAYVPRVETPGVSFAVSPASVTVGSLGAATVTVTMTANAAQMKHTRDETVPEVQGGLPRQWLTEAQGLVTFSQEETARLRVPVYAAPRPTSDMRASTESLALNGTTLTATIPLSGTGVNTGENYPVDEVSLVTAFELQYTSPQDEFLGGVNAKADLQYVGVTSDFRSTQTITNPTGVLSNTTAYFGIATYGDWSTPTEVEFDIYIDTNRDGESEYVVFNYNTGSLTSTNANDVFVSLLCPLENGSCTTLSPLDFLNGVPSDALDTRVFNTNVMVLPVPLSELGLTSANGQFDYQIGSFSLDLEDFQSVADATPVLTYNAAKPGLDLTGGFAGVPAYLDLPGESIPVQFDPFAYLDNRSEGVLLFHHFNAPGNRTQVITVASGAMRTYLPLVNRQ